ncbi:MAG TPA: hypothetical protein VEK56_05050 [Vicinamibacterales bacterium]|nr:hypothetical protein [Vicinamibacterales bacterium]
MRKINTRWVAAAGAMTVISLVWINLPPSRMEAQAPPALVPVMLSNPVGIKGTVRSGAADVVSSGDRAVLTVTNVGDEPVDVRMAIRDALNFSRELAMTDNVLQPGEGASLPYVEDETAFRSVIGVISPGSDRPFGSAWNGANWNGGIRAIVTSLSVVDADNTTRIVVGTSIMPVPRTAFQREVPR